MLLPNCPLCNGQLIEHNKDNRKYCICNSCDECIVTPDQSRFNKNQKIKERKLKIMKNRLVEFIGFVIGLVFTLWILSILGY